MGKTLGVIQVQPQRAGTRWRAARKLGGMSLLELVARRVTDCQRLDEVVVLADPRHDDEIRQLVPPDVQVFTHDGPDPLAGFVAVGEAFDATSIVRVCAENPFLDAVLIDRLVSAADDHPECDCISYRASDGRPAILSPVGLHAEWCRLKALAAAHRQARGSAQRENVTAYIYAHPEQFRVRLVPLPAGLDRDDLRLRLDVEEDWEHAQVIYEALGPGEWDWRRLARLLDHQPQLRGQMARLNRTLATA